MSIKSLTKGALNYATPMGLYGKVTGDFDFGDAVMNPGEALNSLDRTNNGFKGVNQEDFIGRGLEQELARNKGYNASNMFRVNEGQEFRGGQSDLVGMLQQRAAGQGPSAAGQQFDNAREAGVRQQMALAAGNRRNPALAQRQAAQNASSLTSQLAGGAATARIQEQNAAQGQLGSALNQARQGDQRIDLANQQGKMTQQGNLLNLIQQDQNARANYQNARTSRFTASTQVPTKAETGLGIIKGALGPLGL